MGLSEKQVEQHIANVKRRSKSERELKQHGLEFAKLCYQVKKHEEAIRYLKEYLSLNSDDYRAHKWMGRLYMDTGDLTRAIIHYKMSLKLKKDQNDVIILVAELYCRTDNPPIEEMKESLAQVIHISQSHPTVLALREKIQSLEGTSSSYDVEKMITKQIVLCSSDVNLHIRLMKFYTSSGNVEKAFNYCRQVCQQGLFMKNLIWQQCVLSVTEKFYEEVGCGDTERQLEGLISVLEGISMNFVLQISITSLSQCAALLLKYDKVLFIALQALQSFSNPDLTVYHIALREHCGNFHYLISQYLYLHGRVLGRASDFQLGHVCLLASLRVPPPDKDNLWSQGLSSRCVVDKWYIAACTRLSIVGRHLMIVASLKGIDYLMNLPKFIALKEKSINLSLIKTLFTSNHSISGASVCLGTKLINFSLQESFLALDDNLSDSCIKFPTEERLFQCDEVFIKASGEDLRQLVWMVLIYKAINLKPEIGEWLSIVFKGLQLDSPDLARCDLDTLCQCDLEVFLILLAEECRDQLISQRFGEVERDSTISLSAVLANCLPCTLTVKQEKIDFWDTIHQYVSSEWRISETASMKASIKKELYTVRGCRPLQLNLNQLTLLARHFKSRAEMVIQQGDSDGINHKSEISMLMRWSSHYWSIISDTLSENQLQFDALLIEAQMSLATAALFRCDTSEALRLYSLVNTPQAAWNQSQIYLLLAEKEGGSTPKSIQMRISNLTKALGAITVAISRLCVDDDPALKERLYKQQEELKQRLEDAKASSVACALHYEDSPPKPYHSSTPAKQNFINSSDVQTSSDCFREELKEKDELLLSLNVQLKQLQEEMETLKSWHSLSTPGHWSTSISSTIDRDVKLSTSLLAPVISENLSLLDAAPSGSLPSVVSNSSLGQVSVSPCLLPKWSEHTVSNDVGSFGTPPRSNSTIAVSSQDFSSLQLSSGDFLFGLSASVSKPFKFNVSSSSLSAMPFCGGCTSAECNPPLFTSASVEGSASLLSPSSGGVPAKNTSSSNRDETAVATSSNIQFFGTLPLHSVQLPSNATVTTTTLPTLHAGPAGVPITSNIGAIPLLEKPPYVANTSKFQSANIGNRPALHSGSHFSRTKPLTGLFHAISTTQDGSFLSQSDVEVNKQLSYSSLLTWTPQSSTNTTQVSTSDTTPILLPQTQIQSTANSFHPMLLSSTSSGDLPRTSLYNNIVPSNLKIYRDVGGEVTDNTSSCDRESSPHFEPLVSLPLIKELNSGEEDEKVLFCHRAKIYRYDNSQWKERGVGNMKILKHKISGKARLLMRRDQILKLCCNHFISGNMTITEMKGSSQLAWCTNCDFSDGVSKPEKFAIKFKHQETGSLFKQIFEECALCNSMSDNTSEELSIPGQGSMVSTNQTSISLDEKAILSQKEAPFLDSLLVANKTCSVQNEASDAEYGSTKPISEDSVSHTPPTDHCKKTNQFAVEYKVMETYSGQQPDDELDEVIFTKVEMPSNDKLKLSRQLMLPDTFFNYENKPPCPGCRGCIDQIDGKYLASQNQEHKFAIDDHSCEQSTSLDVFGSTLAVPVVGFAELAASESSVSPFSQLRHSSPLHAFKGAGEALFEKRVEGMDDLGADDNQFKAIVSLPEVDVKTGEENEEVLFTHKAKLFRFDTTISQWKERGIGDIKLLRNVNTNKVRIIMRRDQILKVCCNHFITPGMSLLAHQERSWMWFTPNDFADEVPRPEKFAVKFKSAEIAQMFKLTFENCVSRCNSDTSERSIEATKKVDTSDISLKERFAPKRGSWICSICSVCNPESVTLCLACQSPKPGLSKLLSPQNSTAILKELHICSPAEVAGNRTTGGFQLPLNITLPTCSTTSISVTNSTMTTVSLSPRLTSPDLHSLMSVSEKEEVTFSARGILYVENLCDKQWDEGSHGEMKIIKNKFSREKRLLMISEDQKSAICSHGITSMMHLRRYTDKEKAWIWNGFDNSRSTPTKSAVQKYCIEFHSEDDALRFKNSFGTSFSVPSDSRQPPCITNDEVSSESCNEISVEVTLGDNQSETSSERDDDVIFVCEEIPDPSLIKKAQELLLPKSFYLYEKKSPCSGCRGCDDGIERTSCDLQIVAKPTTFTEPDSVSNCKDDISATVGFSSAGMLSFTDLISKEDSSMSSFPKFNRFQFDGAGKQLFSFNLKGDYDPEAEADIEFSPLVSLPETYLVKSWDEDAKILFLQRAKLYRFDGSVRQWKERGIGDMKILQHDETKKVCLIMRRDQILKLCCNHYLTEDMQLIQLETERSWMWFTPSDFSGDKPQPEQFAIRFKCAERGLEFKKVFDECVVQQKLTAKHMRPQPTVRDTALNNPDVNSWECPDCFVRNKNKDYKCAACGCINPGDCLDSVTVNLGSTGGVNISSLVSMPTVSNTEPNLLNAESTVGGIKIPLLQNVHLSTSKSLIPEQTSLPSDSAAQITAAASPQSPTAPLIIQDKDHNSAPDQNRSDTV